MAPSDLDTAHRDGDTVLVVDDDADIREMLRQTLEQEGYAVYTAESGLRGIVEARAKHPHIILLDLVMPGINGIGVCLALRQRLETRNIPIIFVSAASETRYRVEALEKGGDDYLTKPFSTDELLARMAVALRRARHPPEETP